MLLGVLVGKKTYRIQKYIFVFLIVIGVIVFSFEGNKKEKEDHLIGMAIILAALLMDGLTGATQDRMRSVAKPTSLNLMYFINAWSSLYLMILLIFTFEGIEFIKFCIRHPLVMADLAVVIFVGSIAQYFISQMISLFGSLPLSLVMTIRKFLTVFLSVFIWGNQLLTRQWIAACVIFSALLLDAVFQDKPSEKKVEIDTKDEDEKAIKLEPDLKIPIHLK